MRLRPISTSIALVAVLGGVGLTTGVPPVAAQSGLERVEQLTRVGRSEEARVALLDWWENERSGATRRELQRGLWLRGRLTVDPVQAELDFQRLVLLYPSGQFTPDAVLRLAQASWAMGDEPAARGYMDTLRRDYRRTDAWERAQAWIADAGPLPPPGDTPTRAVESVPASTTGDPGDTTVARPSTDSGRDPDEVTEPLPTEEAPAETVMNYYVQLGAFADEERALSLYEEVRAQDVDVRVVRVEGSQFTHVRVGRFAERAAAVALLEELSEQGIRGALVRDDRPERPAGN